MKFFLTCIAALFLSTAQGQWLPDADLYRVRIANASQTQVFDAIPVNRPPLLSPEKVYYWYSANQIHATQGGFSGKLLNGKYDEYFLTKALKQQGTFKKGLKDGEWRSWDEQGRLQEIISWKKGEKNGPFQLFDEEGRLKQSGAYYKGSLHGEVSNRSAAGTTEKVYYKNGKVTGPKMPLWKRMHLFKKKEDKHPATQTK